MVMTNNSYSLADLRTTVRGYFTRISVLSLSHSLGSAQYKKRYSTLCFTENIQCVYGVLVCVCERERETERENWRRYRLFEWEQYIFVRSFLEQQDDIYTINEKAQLMLKNV